MAPKQKVSRSRKPHLQIRCSVLPMLETMQIVKDSHLKLLQRTPFWPLLEAFHNGTISKSQCTDYRTPTLNIIQTFNPETTSFQFGTRGISISTEDISQILGLPQHGEAVQFGRLQYKLYKSDFTERHFKGIDTSKLHHRCLHGLLLKLLNGKDQRDIEDVVRLTLMELFLTFLFARSHTSLTLMKYCDEFDKLSRYSWAEAVGEFLNKSLVKQSKFDVEGCSLLIPFWFCEKTNITHPISGREGVEGQTPALIKWSLPELNAKMQQTAICDIQPLFKEQVGAEAQPRGENEKQEEGKGEEDQEELKKTEKKGKGRGLSKQLEEEIEGRRKLQHNSELSNVKANLEDKHKAERDEKMGLKDRLNPHSPSTAIQSSPRDEIEVSQFVHDMRSPPKGTAVRVRKLQLDPDFVCDVVPKNKKAKKQHAQSDPTLAVPSRSIQDAGKKDEPIIIIGDDSVSEEEESSWKQKSSRKNGCFCFERCEVFKLMDDEHQQKVKAFWTMADPKELFWSGKNASVARGDVEKLIKDTAVASNLIDAFMELMEQQQQSSVKKSTYISTLCWNYVPVEEARKKGKKDQVRVEVRDEMGLNHLVFDLLLRSMAESDYVFFPIISKFHYSLLILNKNEKKWTHHNPLRKRSELHIDPCYESAKKMHQLIQKWLHTTQKEAPNILLKGMKRNITGRKQENRTEVPLNEDEKRSLIWMVDHNIDFKIENDPNCPQQDFKSLDCGIFVMYYMNQLSQGLQLEEEISECRMWEFRKDLIELFVDHENSWKQNSTT